MLEPFQQEEENEQGNRWKHELDNKQESTRSPSKNQAERKHFNDEGTWGIVKEQLSVEKEHGHLHLQEQDFSQEIERAENHSV